MHPCPLFAVNTSVVHARSLHLPAARYASLLVLVTYCNTICEQCNRRSTMIALNTQGAYYAFVIDHVLGATMVLCPATISKRCVSSKRRRARGSGSIDRSDDELSSFLHLEYSSTSYIC